MEQTTFKKPVNMGRSFNHPVQEWLRFEILDITIILNVNSSIGLQATLRVAASS
jgi:hypothetical protein